MNRELFLTFSHEHTNLVFIRYPQDEMTFAMNDAQNTLSKSSDIATTQNPHGKTNGNSNRPTFKKRKNIVYPILEAS